MLCWKAVDQGKLWSEHGGQAAVSKTVIVISVALDVNAEAT
jgi:hypothetical protein